MTAALSQSELLTGIAVPPSPAPLDGPPAPVEQQTDTPPQQSPAQLERPLFSVVRGDPDAVELAALVAGLAAAADEPNEETTGPGAEWANRSRYLPGPTRPTAWRWSAHPTGTYS